MKTSIARKVLMALSGFFLISFLTLHFIINFISVISPDNFNIASHWMGTNPVIQFAMQPVLIFGVVFHLAMGMRLEMQNNKARGVKYAKNNPGANASWVSRNMIITGAMIFLFLGLHFYDFWVPEIIEKFSNGFGTDATRYYPELQHKFQDPARVGLYSVSFIFLALHLMHGFQSAFQSVGFNHSRYTPVLKALGKAFAIVVPLGFIFIAIFHYVSH